MEITAISATTALAIGDITAIGDVDGGTSVEVGDVFPPGPVGTGVFTDALTGIAGGGIGQRPTARGINVGSADTPTLGVEKIGAVLEARAIVQATNVITAGPATVSRGPVITEREGLNLTATGIDIPDLP